MIEGISDNAEIKNGAKVVTTGLSEVFPSGILIGEVKNVTKDKYDLARAVEVTPSVNFNDINNIVKELQLDNNLIEKNKIIFNNKLDINELINKISKYKIDKLLIEELTIEDLFMEYYK